MKFGIGLNFAVPKPWGPGAESQVFRQNAELSVLADELGLDTVWATEHHFLQEYSHQSSPDIFFAYLAGLTKQIRFGHGIYLMLPRMNHPARVAERVATLDIVSNGRVEFGTGRSATWTEMGGFEINPDDTREMWEESTRAVVGMWTNEEYSQRGRFVSFPPRNVVPRPVQQPHPPIWVAVQSPETAVLAGQHGIGMYGVTLGGIPKYADLVSDYRRAIKDCDSPIGTTINNQVRASVRMYIDADSKHADEMVGKPGELPSDNLSALQLPVSTSYPSVAYFAHSQGSGLFSPFGSDQVGRMIGNPDEVAKAVEDWYRLGVDAINLQIEGRFLTFEDKKKALRMFAREVMPRFLQRETPGYIRDAA